MNSEQEELYKALIYLENELDETRKKIVGLNEALSIQVEFKAEENEKINYLTENLKNVLKENLISIKKYDEINKEINKSKTEISSYENLILNANKQLNDQKAKINKIEKALEDVKLKLNLNKKGKVLLFTK
jgi:chromosome segregation ATPase